MYCNAIGAKPLGIYSRFYYIRVITTAAIAQRGKFVDVYTKLCHAQN
jgi:CDP-diacylglycerol pyrophosphatase